MAAQVKPAIGPEIAKAIGDEPPLIDFDSPRNMRAMAEDNICARIHGGARKAERITAVFLQIHLRLAGHSVMAGAFGPDMAGHHDDIGLGIRRLHHLGDPAVILDTQ